jgi:transcriptional regulator with XRE-family HTH domain
LKQKFADIIRVEREKAGFSQDRLASTAGISTRFYQDIESGAKQASLETIFKLSDGLGCHYSVILEPVWLDWLKGK